MYSVVAKIRARKNAPDLHATETVNLFKGRRRGLQNKKRLHIGVVLGTPTLMLKLTWRLWSMASEELEENYQNQSLESLLQGWIRIFIPWSIFRVSPIWGWLKVGTDQTRSTKNFRSWTCVGKSSPLSGLMPRLTIACIIGHAQSLWPSFLLGWYLGAFSVVDLCSLSLFFDNRDSPKLPITYGL